MNYAELAGVVLSIAFNRDPQVDMDWAAGVAADMWKVSSRSSLMCGSEAAGATAIVLLSIAQHESGLWMKVGDCSVCHRGSRWCGGGAAISLYQLEGRVAWHGFTRTQICESNELATELALRVLQRYRRSTDIFGLFKGYTHGARKNADREMYALYSAHARAAGISVAYQNGCLTAEKVTPKKTNPSHFRVP